MYLETLLPVKVLIYYFCCPISGFIGFQTLYGQIFEVLIGGCGMFFKYSFSLLQFVCIHHLVLGSLIDVLTWLVNFFYRTFPSTYVLCSSKEIVCVKHVLHSYKMFKISNCLVSDPLIGLSVNDSLQERVNIYSFN